MKNSVLLVVVIFSILQSGLAQSLQSFSSDNPADRILELRKAIAVLEDDHCEVPCGIYGDSLRIALLYEHVRTVEKGMQQINEISAAEKPNYNQLVRWVVNKEAHAEEIQHIVSQYFLHQRIKMPKNGAKKKDAEKYKDQLAGLHAILVYAMKAKQSTEVAVTEMLKDAIHAFEHMYFGDH